MAQQAERDDESAYQEENVDAESAEVFPIDEPAMGEGTRVPIEVKTDNSKGSDAAQCVKEVHALARYTLFGCCGLGVDEFGLLGRTVGDGDGAHRSTL